MCRDVGMHTVPARIVDALSSDDVTVQEGESVSLVCHVTGVPQPEVRWRRKQTMSPEAADVAGTAVADRHLSDGQSDFSSCQLLTGSTNRLPPPVCLQVSKKVSKSLLRPT